MILDLIKKKELKMPIAMALLKKRKEQLIFVFNLILNKKKLLM